MDKEKDDKLTVKHNTLRAKYGTLCFLCGEFIEEDYPSRYPQICPKCKELWKKLKEREESK